MKALLILFLSASLLACSSLPRSAQQQDYSLSEEISSGVFVIEVQQTQRWYSLLSQQQHLLNLKQHWRTRASKLCQFGYQGDPSVILPTDAQIKVFQCHNQQCNQQPMVSGIAWCHKRYQL